MLAGASRPGERGGNMLEKTLVLIKPDGVRRALTGEVITRLERAGLKLIAMKMLHAERNIAKEHYLHDDIATRHSEAVWEMLLEFITESPIVAAVFEGVSAIKVVRKLSGSTEPAQAAPGTIRGDFCHHSFDHCDIKKSSIRNIIHASASLEEAHREIAVWFKETELLSYHRCDEHEVY